MKNLNGKEKREEKKKKDSICDTQKNTLSKCSPPFFLSRSHTHKQTAYHCAVLLSQKFGNKIGERKETKKERKQNLSPKSLRRSRSSSGGALPLARRGLGLLHQRPELRRHLVGALEHRGRVAEHVSGRGLQLLRRERDAPALAVVGQDEDLDLVSRGEDLVDGRDVVVRDLRDVEQACFCFGVGGGGGGVSL